MVKRGKAFNSSDNQQLCYSYLEITEDAVVGMSQRNMSFWDRVAVHYNERHKPERPSKSLEYKWGQIRKETTKFIGCYETVVKQNHSGTKIRSSCPKSGPFQSGVLTVFKCLLQVDLKNLLCILSRSCYRVFSNFNAPPASL
jgi:hypothetical protein